MRNKKRRIIQRLREMSAGANSVPKGNPVMPVGYAPVPKGKPAAKPAAKGKSAKKEEK
jgi:hypothetical protein